MILYSIIIIISLFLVTLFNSLLTTIGFWTILLYSLLTIVVMIAIDGVVALSTRIVPPSKVNPFKKIYKITKLEKKVYVKLGIKVWKEKIPEFGKIFKIFAKDKIYEPKNNEYLLKYLKETWYAEVMHFFSIFFAFTALLFLPYKLNIVLPIVIVNAILQIMPIMVQRYNRERLITLYNYNLKHSGDVNEQKN